MHLSAPPPYFPPPDNELPIVYQDDYLLVLNKPSGLLSVPGRGSEKADCMASRAQKRDPSALIVHRLDMETSGLLLMARGPELQRQLSGLFEQRLVEKRYIALIEGCLEPERGEVNLPLITDWPNRPRQMVDHTHGKPSLTRYECLAYEPACGTTRVALEPLTGRSHQLRVHMLALGHPILGDALYAPQAVRAKSARLCLHAQWLAFPHPITGQRIEYTTETPF